MQIRSSSNFTPSFNMQSTKNKNKNKHPVSHPGMQSSVSEKVRQAPAAKQTPNTSSNGMVTNLRALPGAHPAAWQQRLPSGQVTDSKIKAESCYRPLNGMPFIIGVRGSLADRDNNIIGHEHIFFSDGTNIGYGSGGIMVSENKSEYSMCKPLSANKKEIIENATKMSDQFQAQDYKLLDNNCQDFVEKVSHQVK